MSVNLDFHPFLFKISTVPQYGGASIHGHYTKYHFWGTHRESCLERYLRAQMELEDKQTCFEHLLLTCDQMEATGTARRVLKCSERCSEKIHNIFSEDIAWRATT